MSHVCIGGCGWPVGIAGRMCESCRAQPWREREQALAEIHKLRKELGVAKLQACLDRDAARAELVALRGRVEKARKELDRTADGWRGEGILQGNEYERAVADGIEKAEAIVRAALEDT